MAAVRGDITSTPGFVDKRRLQGAMTSPLSAPVDYTSVSAMIGVLQSGDSATFTDVRCNQMTKNDLVYAVRQMVDPTGI